MLAGYEIDDTIALPPNANLGIGIIGCGGIVNYAHLPAYRKAGLNILACYDQNPETARTTAVVHAIPVVSGSLEKLLANPEIAIVDIAIHPGAQLDVALQAIAAGKHLLCQKPLSDNYPDAVRIVEAAEAAGVQIAVNQQMRWSAGMRVAKQLITQGAIGTPADARIEVSVRTPWHMWPWIGESERIEIMFHSIHYQDSIRYLFGDPSGVTSIHRRFPNQPERGETRSQTVFTYPDELTVLIDVDHHNWSDDVYARFRFLGDRGIITGTIGLLYDYPAGRVDSLCYQANDKQHIWHEADLHTWWIPDAFLGPMASLMEAIHTGQPALTNGRDNLGTLHTVFASYQSAAENRMIPL
ncbi:MAG TPA: Gfo/Idh/MocA family oxidoreductase [Thermomicrobiales bacterium]|nr:Gfo/Idh/MocA family oxidoreductase [Thermomicrobiales bacterium]